MEKATVLLVHGGLWHHVVKWSQLIVRWLVVDVLIKDAHRRLQRYLGRELAFLQVALVIVGSVAAMTGMASWVSFCVRKIWVACSMLLYTPFVLCLSGSSIIYWICRESVGIRISVVYDLVDHIVDHSLLFILWGHESIFIFDILGQELHKLVVVDGLHFLRRPLSVIIIFDFVHIPLINLLLHIKIFIQITAIVLPPEIVEVVEPVVHSWLRTSGAQVLLQVQGIHIIFDALELPRDASLVPPRRRITSFILARSLPAWIVTILIDRALVSGYLVLFRCVRVIMKHLNCCLGGRLILLCLQM